MLGLPRHQLGVHDRRVVVARQRMTKQFAVDAGGEVLVASVIRMTGIAVLIVTEELPGFELRSTEKVESVKILCASGESDIRDEIRKLLIDDLLLHLINAILVEWGRHHDVDGWLAVEVKEGTDQLSVIGLKVELVPLVRFAIISAKHNDDDVGLEVKGLFILLLGPVGIVSLTECGSTTDAKVDDFVIACAVTVRKHVCELDGVRMR